MSALNDALIAARVIGRESISAPVVAGQIRSIAARISRNADECDNEVAIDLVAHALDLTRIANALDGLDGAS